MNVSMNELNAAVRKAFRGAGYHWGEAEEAGKAATWLAQRGFSVGQPLAALLRAAEGNLDSLRPAPERNRIRDDHRICPVLFGISLADGAISLGNGEHLPFALVRSPLLLLPFLSAVSHSTGLDVSLVTPQLQATLSKGALSIHHSTGNADSPAAGTLTASAPQGEMRCSHATRSSTADLTHEDWELFGVLAGKTYVPASEHSRIAGAGAGTKELD